MTDGGFPLSRARTSVLYPYVLLLSLVNFRRSSSSTATRAPQRVELVQKLSSARTRARARRGASLRANAFLHAPWLVRHAMPFRHVTRGARPRASVAQESDGLSFLYCCTILFMSLLVLPRTAVLQSRIRTTVLGYYLYHIIPPRRRLGPPSAEVACPRRGVSTPTAVTIRTPLASSVVRL
eukprot:COSAG02_NODE_5438_length_4330_cov_689.008036_3_plen_181_part_00